MRVTGTSFQAVLTILLLSRSATGLYSFFLAGSCLDVPFHARYSLPNERLKIGSLLRDRSSFPTQIRTILNDSLNTIRVVRMSFEKVIHKYIFIDAFLLSNLIVI